jgi:hypothetical protein
MTICFAVADTFSQTLDVLAGSGGGGFGGGGGAASLAEGTLRGVKPATLVLYTCVFIFCLLVLPFLSGVCISLVDSLSVNTNWIHNNENNLSVLTHVLNLCVQVPSSIVCPGCKKIYRR